MKLKEIVEKFNLEVACVPDGLEAEVTGGYASDLLSDVLANGEDGNIWCTLQIHQNIIAVASMKRLSAIILVNNRRPEEETVRKAEEENIPVLITNLPAFDIVGKLYEFGISGTGV